MRKTVILFLAFIIVGFCFPNANLFPEQSNSPQSINRKNWISGEINMIGAGFRYERTLNLNWSVGTNIYFQFFSLFAYGDFGADFSTRFYPSAKRFYIEADVGFHSNLGSMFGPDNIGVAISPGFGWKIFIGTPKGFFMDIGIKSPQMFGNEGYAMAIVPYIGFGGAF